MKLTTLKEIIKKWLDDSPDSQQKRAIEDLLSKKLYSEIGKVMHPFVPFLGRSLLGPGYGRLNPGSIKRITNSVFNVFPIVSGCIYIGYDHRNQSKELAFSMAKEMLHLINLNNKNIDVSVFSKPTMVPLLALACREGEQLTNKKTLLAIMITGFHYQKEYSGVAILTCLGTPISKALVKKLEENTQKLIQLPSTKPASFKVKCFHQDLERLYLKKLLEVLGPNTSTAELIFVYTPLCGVTQRYVSGALTTLGLPLFRPVPAEEKADPLFPALSSLNPKKGKRIFNGSIAVAGDDVKLLLATDPCGRRIGAAEEIHGAWSSFTSQEIAVLLLSFLLRSTPQTGEDKKLVVVSDFKASPLFARMLENNKACLVETEQGFRSIAEEAWRQKNNGNTVLLSFNRKHGFLFGNIHWERDGVVALCILVKMALWVKERKHTLRSHLTELKRQYGPWKAQKNIYEPKNRKPRFIVEQLRKSFPHQSRTKMRGTEWEASLPSCLVLAFNNSSAKILIYTREADPKIKVIFYWRKPFKRSDLRKLLKRVLFPLLHKKD